MLRELIRSEHVKNAIIFCNRKRDVAILLKSLLKHGFNAGALHGDMDQMSRMATLDAFREGRITLLAASDVAARGLDIPDVSHIFNFDVPWQSDDYVHRIGRTGRAGKEGRSLTLVTPDDFKALKDIEKMLGAPVTWIGEAPSEEDIASGSKRRRGGRFGRGGRPTAGRSECAAAAAAAGGSATDRIGPSATARRRRPHRPEREDAAVIAHNGHDHPQPACAAPQPSSRRRSARARTGASTAPRGTGRAGKPLPRADAPRRRRSSPVSPAATAGPRGASGPRGRSVRKAGPRSSPAKPSRPASPGSPRPPRSPDRGREDRGPSPVGLGDHVPAFLEEDHPHGDLRRGGGRSVPLAAVIRRRAPVGSGAHAMTADAGDKTRQSVRTALSVARQRSRM